jgi:WD40 repeat protein
VYDARTGEELETIAIPDCPPLMLWPGTFPPYIDVGKPMFLVTPAGCATRQEFDKSGDVWMRDPTDGSWSLLPVTVFDTTLGVPTLDEAGERFAIGQGGPSQVIELATNDVVYEWEGGLSTLSADGTRMLGGSFNTGFPLELWDIEDQQLLWRFDETFSRGWFSDDETLVYGGGFGGATYVLDAETGFEVIRLRGHTGRQIDVFMSADNQRVATISADGTARVWDIGSVGVSEGLLYTTHDRPRHHMWSSGDAAAGVAAIWSGSPLSLDTDWETVVLDLESGETLMTVAGGSPGLSPDGTMMAYRVVDKVSLSEEQIGDPTVEPGEYYRVGDVRIVDVRSGEVIAELDAPCDTYLVGFQLPELGCGLQAAAFDWDLDFSPDTRLVGLTDGVGDAMVVWEIATGEVIGSDQMETLSSVNLAFTPDGSRVVAEFGCGTEHWLRVYDLDPFTMVQEVQHAENCYRNMIFTPDGSLLVAGDFLGNVVLIDTDTWEVRSQFSAHQGQGVHHVSVSPSGNLIASAGDDGVRVWNIADESLRTEVAFNVDAIRNVMFIDDTHVLAVPRWENIGLVVTLDPSELARLANQRITRTFTEVECATYGIDPCPSLAEIKNR